MRIGITLRAFLVAAIAVAAVSAGVLMAQIPTDPDAAFRAAIEKAEQERAAEGSYAPGRTPWGDPDLRGVYLAATYSPLERSPELGEKAFYTREEALQFFKRSVEQESRGDGRSVHYAWQQYAMAGWQTGARPSLQTSLIVQPSNGRLPPLTREAEQRHAASVAAKKRLNPAVSVSTFDWLYTRCTLGNWEVPHVRGRITAVGAEAGVTSEIMFFQSPGYVTVVSESNNDVRIIPLDGRPHLSDRIRQWNGDARGRWEGDTLVIETTNFKDRSPAEMFPGSPRAEGPTEGLTIVERLTKVAPGTMKYEYTMTDPNTWTQPWRVNAEMARIDASYVYEFACHEQNYGIINVIQGTRFQEREGGTTREGRGRVPAR